MKKVHISKYFKDRVPVEFKLDSTLYCIAYFIDRFQIRDLQELKMGDEK